MKTRELETKKETLQQRLTETQAALIAYDESVGTAVIEGADVDELTDQRADLVNRKQVTAAALETVKQALVSANAAEDLERRKAALNELYDIKRQADSALKKHEKTVKLLRDTLTELKQLQHQAISANNRAGVDPVGLAIMPLKSETYLLETYLNGHDINGKWLKDKLANIDIRTLL